MNRVFLTVLDAVGAGEAPDAAEYGDAGANTLSTFSVSVSGSLFSVLLLLFISRRQNRHTSLPGSAGSSLQMLHSSISSDRDSPFISCRQTLQYFSSSRM